MTGNCPPLFEEVGGRCYFFSSKLDVQSSHEGAKQFCLDMADSFGKVQLAKLDDDYIDYKNIVQYMTKNSKFIQKI